ncbi:MAG: CRISPR system precrRNA processing endoribonuclease RAMP protein Cas6 [Bryobacteraceae bacterium]
MSDASVSLQGSATADDAKETFVLYPLRFRQIASRNQQWSANTLRGAFGAAMKRLHPKAYEQYFAPRSLAGPSGLATPPRPFVFRLRENEVGLNLFAATEGALGVFQDGMRELGFALIDPPALLRLPLKPSAKKPATNNITKLRVRFLSPTEIERGAADAEQVEFGVLARRVRDRVSTLRALYGTGALDIDFAAFGAAADMVRTIGTELKQVREERVSKATGQRHPIGGFTGFAEYEGELTMFVPYFEAAQYTGVGRQTVWGKGEISVEEI